MNRWVRDLPAPAPELPVRPAAEPTPLFDLTLTPEVRAKLEDNAEHARTCNLRLCDRCGRLPPDTTARKLALATVPPAYADAHLDAPWLRQLVGPAALERARDAMSALRVAIVGTRSRIGKTSLAVAMFRAAVREPRFAGARYVSAYALAKARSGARLGDGEASLIELALAAPLLVVDEVGGEDARYGSAVAEVIYERHAWHRATWITTAATSQALAQRYGEGIDRRIVDGAIVIKLG